MKIKLVWETTTSLHFTLSRQIRNTEDEIDERILREDA
jgi:hypothetical protein